jgi:pyruvate formate lyase activating enzyme
MNVCPQGAIKSTETGQTVTLRDLCINCGNCTLVCYTRAREMKGQKMSVQEVVDMVKKDQVFYESSGGGVTLGGGEPLLRPGFAASVIEECKKSGIHSAIETAGHVSWSSFEVVLPFTDLFLFDLKHMDSKIHEAYTGIGNEIILANLRKLSGLTTNIIVRVPIIPDFNDHDAEILKIARFVSELKIRELHLLPYHRYGEEKYRYLGREYPFAGKKNIEDRKIERLKELACSENLSVKVGG